MAKNCIYCGHVNEDSVTRCVCGGDLDKAALVGPGGGAISPADPAKDASTQDARRAIITGLNRLNIARNVVVGIALVLLVLSLIMRTSLEPDGRMVIAVFRSFAWGAAGMLSLARAAKAKEAGLSASYGSAISYFVVAVLPLLKGY